MFISVPQLSPGRALGALLGQGDNVGVTSPEGPSPHEWQGRDGRCCGDAKQRWGSSRQAFCSMKI